MKNISEYLKGYKTYIAGIVCVGLGVYYNNMEMIMLGLVSMGLRSAIK